VRYHAWRAHWEDWRAEVIDMDGNRVDKVLIGHIAID